MSDTKDKSLKWYAIAGIATMVLIIGCVMLFRWVEVNNVPEIRYEDGSYSQTVYGETYEKVLPGGETLTHQLLLEPYGGRKYTPRCFGECHLPIKITTSELKTLDEDTLKKYFYQINGVVPSDCVSWSRFDVGLNVSYYENVTPKTCLGYYTEELLGNGSNEKLWVPNCTVGKTEKVNYSRIDWSEFNPKLASQNVDSDGIVVDVVGYKTDPFCKIDAVPEFFGEKLDEYAVWDSYTYTQNITLPSGLYKGDTFYITVNTSTLISSGHLNDNCSALHLASGENTEIDFVFGDFSFLDQTTFNVGGAGCNDVNTTLIFQIQANTTTELDYVLYYDNQADPWEKHNASNVFVLFLDFERVYEGGNNYTGDWVGTMDFDSGYLNHPGGNEYIYYNFSEADVPFYNDFWWSSSMLTDSAELFRMETGNSSNDDKRGYDEFEDLFIVRAESDVLDIFKSNTDVPFKKATLTTGFATWINRSMNFNAGSDGDAQGFQNNTPIVWDQTDNNFVFGNIKYIGAFVGATKWDSILMYAKPSNQTFTRREAAAPAVLNQSWGPVNQTIVPALPITTNPLNLSWDDDNQTDAGNYTITSNETKWLLDGVHNTTFNNFTQILAVNTQKAENWSASVRIWNGTKWSNWTNATAVIILNSGPSVPTQNAPANDTITPNLTAFLNCSGSVDPNSDTINYEFWNATEALQNSTATEYEYQHDDNTTFYWKCRANDGTNVSAYTINRTIRFDSSVVRAVQEGHSDGVSSGSTQLFFFNVSVNNLTVADVNVSLTYNNTVQTVGKYAFNTSLYLFNASVYVPFGNASHAFTWNVTIRKVYPGDSNESQLYHYTQSVNIFYLERCKADADNDTFVIVANLTLHDEVNDTVIYNGSVKATFEVWKDNPDDRHVVLVDINPANGSTYVCLSPNRTLFKSDAIIEYVSPGYDTRRHYYINQTLNSTNQSQLNTNLSLLLISLGTGISFTVQDEAENPYINVYIGIERYDPGTNTYKTVSMLETDDNGQDYSFLRMYDVLYRYRVLTGGGVLAFLSEKAVIQATSQVITISEGGWAGIIDDLDQVLATLTFDNISSTFTMTFTTADNLPKTVCMSVYQNNLTYSSMVSDNCSTGTSGTLTYTVSGDSAVWIGQAYVSGSVKVLVTQIVDRVRQVINSPNNSLVIGLLVMIALIGVGLWSETTAILMGTAGLLILIPLGLVNFTAGAFIALAIVAVIILAGFKR